MNGKTFVDTNVLIYAHDRDAKAQHAVAKDTSRTRFVCAQDPLM
jgi:predicted nucleic acid-binding protein